MDLVLKRSYFNDATIGYLFPLGKDNPLWHTIERPDLDNQRNISCIPEGVYEVKPYSSEKYPEVWEVQNVKDRSKILFHWGNWTSDTDGCVIVGMGSGYMHNQGVNGKAVYNSRAAIANMKHVLGYPSTFNLYIRS